MHTRVRGEARSRRRANAAGPFGLLFIIAIIIFIIAIISV